MSEKPKRGGNSIERRCDNIEWRLDRKLGVRWSDVRWLIKIVRGEHKPKDGE